MMLLASMNDSNAMPAGGIAQRLVSLDCRISSDAPSCGGPHVPLRTGSEFVHEMHRTVIVAAAVKKSFPRALVDLWYTSLTVNGSGGRGISELTGWTGFTAAAHDATNQPKVIGRNFTIARNVWSHLLPAVGSGTC
jgi:hypothetical protein